MKRILFTHPSAELYGSDRTLLQLIEAFGRGAAGEVEAIVALPRRGILADRLEACGAEVVVGELGAALRSDLSPLRFPSFVRKARQGARFIQETVERRGIDLVHTNTSVLLGAAWGARRSGVPHAWHVHEILDEPVWAARTMRSVIARLADLGIANSRATAASMFAPQLKRIAVVHNGVDAARFNQLDPIRARRDVGVAPGGPLVVLPGRINSWKGQRLLVEAVALLREQRVHTGARFLIVGDAPPGQPGHLLELEAEIARRDLGNCITRLPFTEALPSLLQAADVCVIPSVRPEPFGLVAIEAMAAGTAVVAANHGGLAEIVECGVTGQLFEPRSAQGLAGALGRVLEDDVLRARMGRHGAQRQRESFTVDRYVNGILDAYTELLGAPLGARSSDALGRAA